jgi:hypothetical protein
MSANEHAEQAVGCHLLLTLKPTHGSPKAEGKPVDFKLGH